MLLYAGMDLHGDNVFCSVMDEKFSIVFEQRFPNVLKTILGGLAPFRERLAAVVVESTYNWYWLVDGLLEHKYPAMLANPALMQTNIGLKDANDKTDARFIAKQAAMGVLPRSFIYPRDLLRFDHGTSHKGAERFSGPSRRTEPQVCMHTPHRRAAAPAIYWSRMGEMCLRTPAGSGTRTRWVTERNAFAFQFITIAIKPGSNGTSRRSVMAGG